MRKSGDNSQKWNKPLDREVNGLPTTNLMGTFYPSMDAKGRMSFPTKLREIIGERFIVTRGVDGCLFVYSLEDFELIAEKIRGLPISKGRQIQRHFMAGATEVEADKQGRILIPQDLRKFASLSKDIVVAGVTDRAEIWDKERWDQASAVFDDECALKAMEELDF